MDSTTTQQTLKPFLKRVQRAFSPVRIILFGSRARGDAAAHSDYDLLIISPAFEQIAFYERHVRVYQLLHERIEVDVICLTPSEYRRRSRKISIIREAAREGVEIAA